MLTTVLKGTTSTSTLRDLDRLLHPRVPPLVRGSSHMELLTLSRTEESVEEQEIREGLHVDAVLPSSATETTSTQNQQPKLATAPPSLPPYRNPDTSPSADESKVPGQAPSQVPSSYPQPAAPPSLEPAPTPSHGYNATSPARFPSQGISDFNDTLHPLQAHEALPSSVSGVVNAPEESRLGAAPEVINAEGVDDDGDDDEEMPSIDMGSDSDSTEP